MTLNEILTLTAVILAPLVAVQVQKWLEHYREERERRLKIFKTLMATRATAISHEHVQALNLIDLEFQGNKYKKVREAWKEYLDHLSSFPKETDMKALQPVWNEKKADLLANLLMQMGRPLGYEFDAVHVKKGIYLPEGHTKLEIEQSLIRQQALNILFGDASLKLDIKSFPADTEVLQSQKELMAQWSKLLRSETIPVSIVNEGTNSPQHATGSATACTDDQPVAPTA